MSRIRDLKKHRDAKVLNAANLFSAWQWARARNESPKADEITCTGASIGQQDSAQGLHSKHWELITPMNMAGSLSRPRSCPPSKRLSHRSYPSLTNSFNHVPVPLTLQIGTGTHSLSPPETLAIQQQRRWQALKEGIQSLWEELSVAPEERSMFASTFFQDPSMENWQILEDEQRRLTDLLASTRRIFLCIRHREEALEALLQLASSSVDWVQLTLVAHHFRIQTVQCIEALQEWKSQAGPGPEVLWHQAPYLWKILQDTELLERTPLPGLLPFEVRGNALFNPLFRKDSASSSYREHPDMTPSILERLQSCEAALGTFLSQGAIRAPGQWDAAPPPQHQSLPSEGILGENATVDGKPTLHAEAPTLPPSSPERSIAALLPPKVQLLPRRWQQDSPHPDSTGMPAQPQPPVHTTTPTHGGVRPVKVILRRRPAHRQQLRQLLRIFRSATPAATIRCLSRWTGGKGCSVCDIKPRFVLWRCHRLQCPAPPMRRRSNLKCGVQLCAMPPSPSMGDPESSLKLEVSFAPARDAVVRIQCAVRAWLARREVVRRRCQREAEEEREAQEGVERERCGAALVLQRQWRRRQCFAAAGATLLTPEAPSQLLKLPLAGDQVKGHRRQRLQLDPSLIPALDLR
eukprot:GGOE01056050.1.p1 GENE.GGOE01056050.1~~GGOE01056050.1.p1  ORF type:complete len:634 (-),score=47.85 GGOE01056050.1:216-2117(-)